MLPEVFALPSDDHYQRLFNVFLEKKQDMFSLVEDFELLNKKSRTEMLEYLEEFYSIIENPRLAERNIINLCRQIPRN